nr:unnamed protein product [Callosobruchus chinensis]
MQSIKGQLDSSVIRSKIATSSRFLAGVLLVAPHSSTAYISHAAQLKAPFDRADECEPPVLSPLPFR